MPYLAVIAALIVLVVLHELGHFLAARAVGVRATKFYVFFPPAIFKKSIKGVEYGIGSIPAGGFVKLPGMFEPVPRESAERVRWAMEGIDLADPKDALELDAALRRIDGAAGADQLTAPLREVDDVLARQPESARITTARSRVTGLLDDCHPQAYWRADLWRRMVVIFAGPFVNLVVAFIALAIFYWALVPVYEISGPLRVGEVTKQSPAEEAGITAKSEITGWNGPVEGLTTGELNDRVDDGRGKSTDVAWVDANGATHTETLVPRSLDDEGPPLIGVAFAGADQERVGSEDHTLGFGARTALEDMRAISWGNLTGLSKLFFESEAREEVGSVVGIVHVADVVEENDRLLWYAGVISLVLAVMNLLPLLPLDGGHLLFGCFEAIRRRPVPRAVFERYSMVGIGLVLVLFMIGLTNDIGRIRG